MTDPYWDVPPPEEFDDESPLPLSGQWLGSLLDERLVAYDEPLVVGATSGWIDLDDAINGGRGLTDGQFVIVAGRPGVGKSVMVVDWARRLAASGIPTLLMSLEMSNAEIGDRLLSCASGVMHSRISGHVLEDWQKDELGKAAHTMSNLPLRICDEPNVGMGTLRRMVEAMKATEDGLGAVVVDYIGLMSSQDPRLPRQEQVATISRGLKLLAKEFAIKVIVAAQLNRGPENRPDKRPVISDLRESGTLEQDCDIGILLHAPEEMSHRLDAILAKNRNGPKLTISLMFNAPVMRLDNAYRGM